MNKRMRGDCKDCQKSAEYIYWSCFQTVCFFQILTGNFNEQLAVPQKFVNKLREKLAGSVALKGPSGFIWNVGLTALGEELYFGHGWKEFVEEHSLQENDMLLFRYNGGSQFDVLMLDQQTCCEKESSYFIRKCGHQEHTSHHETDSESSVEFIGYTGVTVFKESAKQATPAKRKASEGSNKALQGESSTSSRLLMKSNRRPVTEEEKDKAKEMAYAAVTRSGFTVIMAPGNVYRRFQMTIPSEWAKTYLPKSKRTFDLTLCVKEKTWTARCYHQRDFGRSTILAGSGYRTFVFENHIEEFDVCVFEMASTSNEDDVFFNVSIFRVVEDAVPSSRVTRGSSSK